MQVPQASRAAIPKSMAARVGRRIRERRLALGLTQAAIAAPELTKSLISQIESGQTRPSPTTLSLIADRLGVTVDEIVGPLDDALGSGPQSSSTTAYALRKVEALVAARQWEQARHTLGELVSTALSAAERVVYHRLLAHAELGLGRDEAALVSALTACRHSPLQPDAEQSALAYNAAGVAHFQLNHLPAAIAYYQAATELAGQESVGPAVLARIETNRGNALMRLGDPRGAEHAYERARLAAERGENLRALALARMGAGEASRERGDYVTAVAHMESALQLFERLEHRQLQIQTQHNLGEVYAEQGDFARARGQHEAALTAAQAVGDRLTEAYALERLAACDVRDNTPLRALRRAQEAIAIAREMKDADLHARSLATFGDACQNLGDREQADGTYDDALAVATSAGGRALRQVLLMHGVMLRSRGDATEAAAAFERAARILP